MVRRRRAAGYTLVEVACGFAILSVLASAFAVGQRDGIHRIANAHRHTAALALAAAQLESIDDGKPLQAGRHAFTLPDSARRTLPRAAGLREIRLRPDGCYEVRAEVSWHAPDRPHRQHAALVTLLPPHR